MRIFTSSGYHGNIATHNLLWKVGLIESSVTQLALIIIAHGPQTAIVFEKQTMIGSSSNRLYIAGYNLIRKVSPEDKTGAQLAVIIVSHDPQAAVAFEKQAMLISTGNLGHRLCDTGERLKKYHPEQAGHAQ